MVLSRYCFFKRNYFSKISIFFLFCVILEMFSYVWGCGLHAHGTETHQHSKVMLLDIRSVVHYDKCLYKWLCVTWTTHKWFITTTLYCARLTVLASILRWGIIVNSCLSLDKAWRTDGKIPVLTFSHLSFILMPISAY